MDGGCDTVVIISSIWNIHLIIITSEIEINFCFSTETIVAKKVFHIDCYLMPCSSIYTTNDKQQRSAE